MLNKGQWQYDQQMLETRLGEKLDVESYSLVAFLRIKINFSGSISTSDNNLV